MRVVLIVMWRCVCLVCVVCVCVCVCVWAYVVCVFLVMLACIHAYTDMYTCVQRMLARFRLSARAKLFKVANAPAPARLVATTGAAVQQGAAWAVRDGRIPAETAGPESTSKSIAAASLSTPN